MILVQKFLLLMFASLLLPALIENSPAAVEPATRTAPAARPVPAAGDSAPSPSWTTRATVVNVVDGDTLDIEIRRAIRVRMLDCWSPEKKVDARLPKEKQAEEKQAGLAAKKRLTELAMGKTVVVQVPTDPSGNVSKILTMNRVLGTVWIEGDSESLSQRQVKDGFATKEKREELQ